MKSVSKEKGYDLIGRIAIVKFSKETPKTRKKKFANKLLKKNKSIKLLLKKLVSLGEG